MPLTVLLRCRSKRLDHDCGDEHHHDRAFAELVQQPGTRGERGNRRRCQCHDHEHGRDVELRQYRADADEQSGSAHHPGGSVRVGRAGTGHRCGSASVTQLAAWSQVMNGP